MDFKVKSPPRPPKGLSAEARRWWRTITVQWELDDGGLFILARAMESFDLMRRAQKQLDTEGLTVQDRYGVSKPHPAASILSSAHSALQRYLKLLNLDVEPLHDGPGRPSGH